ncbi:HAUS augmin-like complex subunit 1 isoform X1 [Exaiptasia diaphana]|uniref:HAUS augmin-like complex subunit 1 n=1 Tax=Exaiptasia diaphana TaxID=2652724 RepID=A0A913Y5A2_EXADI|nr:HAUS augmin-like complex subunit 1 isoform X1 [Exaiptasia diaphana]KXJ22669.1 HAUS augmin-like complex subunit 1 [Exaiptasia diaphana]
MDQDHIKVKLWLEDVIQEDSIPQYEINSKTMSILTQLAERNKRINSDTEIVAEDMRQKAVEYDLEAQRMQKVLDYLGLSLSSLSQSGDHSIKILSDIALLLGLKDCTSSSLLLGIINQSRTLNKVLDDRAEESSIYSKLISKTKSALVQANSLQRTFESLEEQHTLHKPVLEKRSHETEFFHNKAKQYHKIVREAEEYQKSLRLESSIFHENLVKKSEDVNYLKEKSKPLKDKLEIYQDLPPDLSLAKVKVEEAKLQLARLEEQLSSNINMLHS